MKCTCTTDLEKRLTGTEAQNRKVLSAKFISIGLIFGNGSMNAITTSEMELQLEGRKKSYIQNILHNYCPFCGTKIKDE